MAAASTTTTEDEPNAPTIDDIHRAGEVIESIQLAGETAFETATLAVDAHNDQGLLVFSQGEQQFTHLFRVAVEVPSGIELYVRETASQPANHASTICATEKIVDLLERHEDHEKAQYSVHAG